jgi:hypothetical protein
MPELSMADLPAGPPKEVQLAGVVAVAQPRFGPAERGGHPIGQRAQGDGLQGRRHVDHAEGVFTLTELAREARQPRQMLAEEIDRLHALQELLAKVRGDGGQELADQGVEKDASRASELQLPGQDVEGVRDFRLEHDGAAPALLRPHARRRS